MSNTLKILVSGDFFDGGRIKNFVLNDNFEKIFNDFLPVVRNNDIAIVNLEAPVTKSDLPAKKFGPHLKMHPKALDALKFAGFNVLSLANNHIMDYGIQGLNDSIDLIKEKKLDFLGAGKNLDEANKCLTFEIRGTKISILNFAENEFSNTHGSEPGANPLNPVSNYYAIRNARENSDYVFVIIHGGHETYQLPSPRMKQTYRFFIDSGADAVVGHHTHCYSGIDIYKNKPIFYSLGNFIFDKASKRNDTWNFGFSVQFFIKDNSLSYKLFPYVHNNENPGVHLLNNEQIKEFESNIKTLNSIISNDDLLEKEFKFFYSKVKDKYASFIELYSNRYINALRKRKLFPSLIRKNKKRLLLNLVRCESHRDILLKLLKEE